LIDGGLLDSWDATVVAATKVFDQGDLVEQPPFFYAAMPTHAAWMSTQLMTDEVGPDEDIVVELDPTDRPPLGIITSQGCDVDEAFRKPWIQIAPVYPLENYATDDRWAAEIRRDSVPHLVLLDPPTTPGHWVADLRIEMPVEKSWLANRTPIPAFQDESGRRDFARRLAGRLERPALPPIVHDVVVRPLRRWLDRRGTEVRTAMADAGVEFRLLAQSDNGAMACRLLVIGRRGPVPHAVVESLGAWWARRMAEEPTDRVVLLGCRYGTSDEISMREYLASELLDDRYLNLHTAVA
jgi:hypothetical protein